MAKSAQDVEGLPDRRTPAPPLAAGPLLAAVVPAPALAQSGGAAAPDSGGGRVSSSRREERATRAPRLRATTFTVTPGTVELGDPLRFAWRVDGPVRTVTARVRLVPEGGGKAITVALGKRRTGTRGRRAPGRRARATRSRALHRAPARDRPPPRRLRRTRASGGSR